MTAGYKGTDRIYIAACARDARLTRICVASIRYFYPDVPIQILAGDVLQPGLAEELKKYWDVEVADLTEGDYGWGSIKLEPLFGPEGQQFLVMDADTVLTGRLLEIRAESDAPFFVDNEELSDADFKRLYFDWDRLRELDPDTQTAHKAFNPGEWFGTAGLIEREEFDPWVEWTLPRKLRYPDIFMGGDQGILNHVILKKEALEGLRIERTRIMRWPGNGMDGLDVESVASGTAPPRIIHWAGMKKTFLRQMVGGDLLRFFESYYYQRLPFGRARRMLALVRNVWIQWSFAVRTWIRLRFEMWFGKPAPDEESLELVKDDIAS